MSRTALASVKPKGPYPGTVSAGDLDINGTAGDAANGNTTPFVGNRMLVVAHNSDAANPYTFTLTSVADSHGRSGTITAYSLAAADKAYFFVERDGWQQSDGALYLDVENAAVLLTVLQVS